MIVNVVGWTAAVALLLGYRLVTVGRVSGESVTYLVLNLFGSIGLGVSTAVAHAWPSAAVNVIWLGLGIGPLVRAVRVRAHRRRLSLINSRKWLPWRPKPTVDQGREALETPAAQPG